MNRKTIPEIKETKHTIKVPAHIGGGSFDLVSLPKKAFEKGELFKMITDYVYSTGEWVYVPIDRFRQHFESK
tara:strand:- start:98 stop:313 length:216 start_codon:yes stop_codon:yes gene_type:complete